MLPLWCAGGRIDRWFGIFENDFAGRIANRVMQTPSSVSAIVRQVFGAMSYASAFVLQALVMLLQINAKLILPLLVWLLLYGLLMRWTVRWVVTAAKAASAAKSEVNRRIIDGYTNIHLVKMLAHYKASGP